MANTQDYYEALKVDRKASADDIRKSYRRLARKYHPDLNPGDKAAEDRFKKLQEAYDVLSEPKKRQMYDQQVFYSDSGFAANARAPNEGAGMGFSGFDFSDYFAQSQGGPRSARSSRPDTESSGRFRDLFSQFFKSGGGGRQAPPPQPRQRLGSALGIAFLQALRSTPSRLGIRP